MQDARTLCIDVLPAFKSLILTGLKVQELCLCGLRICFCSECVFCENECNVCDPFAFDVAVLMFLMNVNNCLQDVTYFVH